MFVNLYLELISNGQNAAGKKISSKTCVTEVDFKCFTLLFPIYLAQKFHSRNTSLFMESQDYKIVAASLSNVFSLEDIDSIHEIKAFRY